MRNLLRHILLPHSTNNYKAKLLQNGTILLTTLFFVLASFIFIFLKSNYPSVLGVSTDLSVQKLLLLTNKERENNGLPPLVLDQKLAQAAGLKAKDMFAKNYWAHQAPDGKMPWYFIKQENYNYAYAGENLARGFDNSDEVVNAWMHSPDHRDNILSQDYRDIGFAVVKGRLDGEDTTLIVELFGSTSFTPVAKSDKTVVSKAPSTLTQNPNFLMGEQTRALIDSSFFTKTFAQSLVLLFILTFALDMLLINRRRIYRLVSHNVDHILFLTAILLSIGMVVRQAII
jgi:uncharacterized protein YkwD